MADQDTSARLRHEACHVETDETLEHVAKLMRAVADELDARQAEIERLRVELEKNKNVVRPLQESLAGVCTERDDLRARLEAAERQEPANSVSRSEWIRQNVSGPAALVEGFAKAFSDEQPIYAAPVPASVPAGTVDELFDEHVINERSLERYALVWLTSPIPAPAAGVPDAITQSAVEALEHLSGACLDINLDRHTLSRFASAAANACRKSLAAPQAAGVPVAWQPIETAPDDMTERVVVRWTDKYGNEHRDLDYREDGCWMTWHFHAEEVEIVGGHGVPYHAPYEHWMPLPAAPQPGEQREQT